MVADNVEKCYTRVMPRKSPTFDETAYRRLVRALAAESSPRRTEKLLAEILTPAERSDLALRWKLLQRLVEGASHRQISRELGISPCKITRGSRILKEKDSVCREILKSEEERRKNEE